MRLTGTSETRKASVVVLITQKVAGSNPALATIYAGQQCGVVFDGHHGARRSGTACCLASWESSRQRPLPVMEGAFLLPLVNVFVNEVGGDPCAQSPRGLLTGTPDSRLVLVILAANLACKLVATLNNCVSRRSPGSAHRPLCGRGSGKPAGRWALGRLSPATAHQIWDLSQYVAPVRSAASVLL